MKKRTILLLSVSLIAGVLLSGGQRRGTDEGGGARQRTITGLNAARHSNVESGSARDSTFEGPTAPSPERDVAAGVPFALPSPLAPETGFVPADPEAPGNFLTFSGRRIAIESWNPHPAGTSIDLLITAAVDPGAAVSSPAAARVERNSRPGLTYEQELFRTKWGWAAFEQVQRAAREEAAVSHP